MSDPNQPPQAFSPNNPPPPPGQQPGGAPPPVPYATPASYGYPGPYTGPTADNDDRTMAMLAHLLGIFTGFLGPLIIWLVKKEKPFVDDQGKEALNFQLTMLIVVVGLIILSCITLGFGFLLFIPFGIVVIVFGILAAVESNKGNAYRYPVNIRMIR